MRSRSAQPKCRAVSNNRENVWVGEWEKEEEDDDKDNNSALACSGALALAVAPRGGSAA